MFERYLTDAVTNHFGHVVENLDADKVRLSAWNGELVLKDLSLRTNALQSFMPDCPVELAYGKVGNLELRIPWTLFRSQLRWRRDTDQPRLLSTSCSVVLSDVNILVTPRRRNEGEDLDENDETAEMDSATMEDRRIAKEKQVQSLLDAKLLQRVTESSVSSGRWNWVQDYLSSLLSTISVTVRNIHIRYEDPGSCMGFVWTSTHDQNGQLRHIQHYRPAFAVGITLQEFSVDSKSAAENNDTPKAENETKMDDNDPSNDRFEKRSKIATAQNLAIYWDSNSKLMTMYSDEVCCSSEPSMTYTAYYEAAFHTVNALHNIEESNGTNTPNDENPFCHEKLYNQAHSYLLDPISPSVNLTLVSEKDALSPESLESTYSSDSDDASNDSMPKSPNEELTPPSSVRINLPPCQLTLARSTLMDTAYVRKSFSVWKHATSGILSESSLRRLAKLRPHQSPLDDPKSWWFYAFQATLALSRINRDGKEPDRFYKRRRRGWMGFIEAAKRKRLYLQEYTKFVLASEENSSLEAHQSLLEMEDDLLPREIVAFRLAAYESIHFPRPEDGESKEPQAASRWLWTTSSEAPPPDVTNETKADILSAKHRISMMGEITLALDREKANMRKSVREGFRISSLPRLPTIDLDEPQANPEVWRAAVTCSEFAIQVNEGWKGQTTPVIRLSSAWVHDHCWYHDGSWDSDVSLASLVVKDLTISRLTASQGFFPNLVGRKQSSVFSTDAQALLIDGVEHHKSISISVRRKLYFHSPDGQTFVDSLDRGSNTKTQIRIQPMEVVYSMVPVDAALRVLGTVKTPELVDDYHRMAAAAHGWRERQKTKFLEALAHERKKIIIDVDVGAPELLVPERLSDPDSPLLAVNLGRLQIFNDTDSMRQSSDFDDNWRVILSDIQVRATKIRFFARANQFGGVDNDDSRAQHLVEPFSLDFAISTKIASQNSVVPGTTTRIRIHATMPRLAFNFSSSAIRLVSRLRRQRRSKRQENDTSPIPSTLLLPPLTRETQMSTLTNRPEKDRSKSVHPGRVDGTARMIQFDFTAPVITLNLDDDSEETLGRLGIPAGTSPPTNMKLPVVALAIQGIRGQLLQETMAGGATKSKFEARLHSLGVIDLYQSAGKEFAMLMSSSVPQSLDGLHFEGDSYSWCFDGTPKPDLWTGQDLVTISFTATKSNDSDDDTVPDRLSIGFHELYVEWNPETMASIQSAIRIPDGADDEIVSEEVFFDAIEEEWHQTGSVHLLSEVASSQDSGSFATAEDVMGASDLAPTLSSETGISLGYPASVSSGQQFPQTPPRLFVHSSVMPLSAHAQSYPLLVQSPSREEKVHSGHDQSQPTQPFELVFQLSSLRVSFNKESRHRKIMIAQMDGTSVLYQTRSSGGSKTKIDIGNLVFTDPSALNNSTLYGQILGLKTTNAKTGQRPSSLLQMEILINPRIRSFDVGLDPRKDDLTKTVTIDRERGLVIGCNFFVKATFSPMRFVFLEQYWFEIIDYFFEGVIGASVWGGKTNAVAAFPVETRMNDVLGKSYLPGSDAQGFSFTRFSISLKSPELLFPVTYRSPHFLKMDLSEVEVSNRYDGTIIEDDPSDEDTETRMQWFNNCSISFRGMQLYSWTGTELGESPVMAHVSLRWPSGPSAPLVVPKWRVNCVFDGLNIMLQRSDYALVQQILTNNIGEKSRHLEEWHELKSLSPGDRTKVLSRFLVHFGYDKKDVTPTTYDLKVTIPSLNVQFLEESAAMDPIAVAQCVDLLWSLQKHSDLVVKQRLSCDVDLVAASESDRRKLLSSWRYDQDSMGDETELSGALDGIPEMTYTSTTLPSGDNTKTLEIVDACIYTVIPVWRQLIRFFSALPEPVFFEPKDIGSLIQVGDRWYRIDSGKGASDDGDVTFETDQGFYWIAAILSSKKERIPSTKRTSLFMTTPTFQFQLLLTSPRIVLSSGTSEEALSHVILRMNHVDFLHINSGAENTITRSFLLDQVEVYTLSSLKYDKSQKKGKNSLIHPWSLGGLQKRCNGRSSGQCAEHTSTLSADVFNARAAYSDMSVAIEVCLSVLHSAKQDTEIRPADSPRSESVPSAPTLSPELPKSQEGQGANGQMCTTPVSSVVNIECDGFEVRVADDTGRHFAGDQDLIIFSLGKILFRRNATYDKTSKMDIELHSLNLFDCLQRKNSRFRTAASTNTGEIHLAQNEGDSRSNESRSLDETRRFDWRVNRTRSSTDFKFEAPQLLVERLQQASKRCNREQWEGMDVDSSAKVKVSFEVLANSEQRCRAELGTLSVQWNPSTVIAIQRFLGRLRKESKSKFVQVYSKDFDELLAIQSSGSGESHSELRLDVHESKHPVFHATIILDELVVCLNKEHQDRRLLELTLSDCRLDLDSFDGGMDVEGIVGGLGAWDSDSYEKGILDKNRCVLRILPTKNEKLRALEKTDFLRLRYRTFKNEKEEFSKAVPSWVISHVSEIGGIDDFLSVKVAATEFTYLKERTEELIDYLSNGLPGKGMGVTSRAAQGFIKKRILTKSFLEFHNESPQIFVPQEHFNGDGLVLKLGDVEVRSYFEQSSEAANLSQEWWRILSLELSGSQGGLRENESFSPITNSIDLRVDLRKPTVKGGELLVRGKLSAVDLLLCYSKYVLIRRVSKHNLGRKVNTDKWDNIEKAYWSETADPEELGGADISTHRVEDGTRDNQRVTYSSNARFVRYGKAGKNAKIKEKGDQKASRKGSRQPCPFQVLAEGYMPDVSEVVNREDGPQFVVTVDRRVASSRDAQDETHGIQLPRDSKYTTARIVVNYLSLNILMRPLKEVAAFFACSWEVNGLPSGLQDASTNTTTSPLLSNGEVLDSSATAMKKTKSEALEVKLVAHYPRVFFLADESDSHSRALVLRGLAVVNLNKVSEDKNDDGQDTTTLRAQLHSMETYINADVHNALSFNTRHAAMVGYKNASAFPEPEDIESDSSSDDLGIALIQPVTTELELCETKQSLFPTRRSLNINIEPVSTMLSFEDLHLIETVLARLSSRSTDSKGYLEDSPRRGYGSEKLNQEVTFSVTFTSDRLGLGLRTEGTKTVISSIQRPDEGNTIKMGDQLVGIDKEHVVGHPLESVVRILSSSKRPVTLRFSRILDSTFPYDTSITTVESPLTTLEPSIESEAFISTFSTRFERGVPKGFDIERCSHTLCPVVQRLSSQRVVDDDNVETILHAVYPERPMLPKTGAILVAIDGRPVAEMGIEQAFVFLSEAANCNMEEIESERDNYYTLTFREIHADLWGKIESVDISSSGIALSFIDDLNGRDMPLFRAHLNSIEIHAERGVGAKTNIIEVQDSSLLHLEGAVEGQKFVPSLAQTEDIKSEIVLTFNGMAMLSIDYFHPRIASWEPFLEPSHLFMLFERQAGCLSARRPGQIAVELSDRLLRRQTFKSGSSPRTSAMVACNITDASAEVIVKASKQWRAWRKTILDGSNNEEVHEEDSPDYDLELRQSTALSESVPLSDLVSEPMSVEPESKDTMHEGSNFRQSAHREAAQKAAQAALNFAQKRGAEKNPKGDTAKPFVLRNRTGVSIAFVQQVHSRTENEGTSLRDDSLATVGEYAGLGKYAMGQVNELADEEEARFSMDIMSDRASPAHSDAMMESAVHKIRNYEGRFPRLTISIQAVAGVLVEPLTDLQVFKVGSAVRHLRVRRDDSRDDTHDYYIPVVWKVEIIDNRRVLTLSTAVRIVTTAFDSKIEVGVKHSKVHGITVQHKSDIQSIGGIRPGCPFYLPLWLALKLEAVDIFVRPQAQGAEYNWGNSSVLRFGPLVSPTHDAASQLQGDDGTWIWEETFEELVYIMYEKSNGGGSPLWLSVFGGSAMKSTESSKTSHTKGDTSLYFEEEHNEVISVTLDSSITLRNMLPMSLDWQIASLRLGSITSIDDGSTSRQNKIGAGISLSCGECTEIFACDFEESSLQARFKEPDGSNWSTWASLALEDDLDVGDDNGEEANANELPSDLPRSRQINVQVTNDSLGVPMTFGVRVVPKAINSTFDAGIQLRVYGFEIIVFAELWIKNLTSLPLNFGCPSHQLHNSENISKEVFNDSATRFNAETALMEIANLLEVGDKSTGLNKGSSREITATAEIESLPNQECDELVEEVFEYLEIDFSTVKRRWWASESYDFYRMNITQSRETNSWNWIDEKWAIDCSGEVEESLGGWESCRNLLAGARSFSADRSFEPSHTVRRRRYFRARSGRGVRSSLAEDPSDHPRGLGSLEGGLQAIHQPLHDAFTREQQDIARKNKRISSEKKGNERSDNDGRKLKIAVKCGDGKWSLPASLPDTGTSHGILRVLASRWPALTKLRKTEDSRRKSIDDRQVADGNFSQPFNYLKAMMSPDLYELCYTVSEVDGEWGEFSRCMSVSPRFLIRNDSMKYSIEVKQAGAPNSTSIKLSPGAVEPFYWADFRLPGLVCVSPCETNKEGESIYSWSGGFDLASLGMIPLRVRQERSLDETITTELLRSIRALVEIRPGTGGFGINVSFRDEDPKGDGALFRVENLTPFSLWFAQDGVLANPATAHTSARGQREMNRIEADGEVIEPSEKLCFALDVPYRQGKYAHRKEASLSELLRIRIALAPLSHRAGIETVKVLGLTRIGENIRINPSKLFGVLDATMLAKLQQVRVLGIITSDGPTRVLKLLLMRLEEDDALAKTFRDVSYIAKQKKSDSISEPSESSRHVGLVSRTKDSAEITAGLLDTGSITDENTTKRNALFSSIEKEVEIKDGTTNLESDFSMDQIYSVRAEFHGFVFSLVDSAPSEIAAVSIRNFNSLARWNQLRTDEASLILSIGRLQVDNHVPNAPFKVAVRQDFSARKTGEDDADESSPLLMIAVAFAPRHKSGIVCLRSVTIAPRNLAIALDLAFLVRLQRFILELKDRLRAPSADEVQFGRAVTLSLASEQKRSIAFPVFKKIDYDASFGSQNQNFYFQGLTILPAAITLSIAPARALTPAQAALEGKELAAIHQAVRKGDVLVGSSSALLGVRVGRKNTTPLAVLRGVFKSIVVDALLRLDGASLNFAGVALRNHFSTGSQLNTYLLTHYLTSLRQNVPALLGSLSAFGNPLGLIRGLGDGVSDFVNEPVRGLQKSVQELDPTYLVDGVARGTESLARHAVGGFADSASLLTETFSKNMAVLTLDRRYAQKRDRKNQMRLNVGKNVSLAGGVESGFGKLVDGFLDGVTGVVRAPVRGAERKGIEGFAKGVGKGLLGLLVKPIIGISDAATDVMIGVKHTVENSQEAQKQNPSLALNQFRPRRPMYGRDKVLRPYVLEDAAAAALMQRTRCAGENYLSHMDMGDRVALFSVKRLILLGPQGQELMALRYKHVSKLEVRKIPTDDGSIGWAIIIILNTPRKNGSEVEALTCANQQEAVELCAQIQRGVDLVASES